MSAKNRSAPVIAGLSVVLQHFARDLLRAREFVDRCLIDCQPLRYPQRSAHKLREGSHLISWYQHCSPPRDADENAANRLTLGTVSENLFVARQLPALTES